MTSPDIKILIPKEIAGILHKSERWVYANAADLGASRIAGSWIFTERGLKDALQREARNMARQGVSSGQTVYKTMQNQKRSQILGGAKEKRVKDNEGSDPHGLLAWCCHEISELLQNSIHPLDLYGQAKGTQGADGHHRKHTNNSGRTRNYPP